jgi:hypothetical protein
LQGADSRHLPLLWLAFAAAVADVAANLANKLLGWQLPDQDLFRLLIPTDLAQCNGA